MNAVSRQLNLFKGSRQRGEKLPLALETRTHIAVADSLNVGVSPGWIWTHVGHGGHRSKVTGALLKRMGLKPGIPDFLLIGPDGVHYWLELKRGKAPLSEAQVIFRDEMWARGVPYQVARSYEEAIAILADWGAIRVRLA